MIEDGELLNKYGTFWNNVSADIKKNLVANLSTIKKKLKTKIKSYGEEVTYLFDKDIPESGSDFTCLAVIIRFWIAWILSSKALRQHVWRNLM